MFLSSTHPLRCMAGVSQVMATVIHFKLRTSLYLVEHTQCAAPLSGSHQILGAARAFVKYTAIFLDESK